MTDTTTTPIIPTPEWKRATRDEFWGTPERNPYLISLTEVADRIGIKRHSMHTNATARPMYFPFDVVTVGRSPNGGTITRYYLRSDVERWIARYLRQRKPRIKATQRHGEPRNPEKSHPPTPDGVSARTGRAERQAA